MKFEAVVISGVPGSGKGTLAKKLGEKLGWKVFSVGDIWREKHRKEYPNNEVSFEEFWKGLGKEQQQEMDQQARKILQAGNAIGDFRFAKSCEGLNVLFVFVTADLAVRAARAKKLGKYGDKEEKEIEIILKNREEDEVRIGKELFGEDYDYRNMGFYGLILDSGDLTVEEEAKFVIGTLEGKEKKEILKMLGNKV